MGLRELIRAEAASARAGKSAPRPAGQTAGRASPAKPAEKARGATREPGAAPRAKPAKLKKARFGAGVVRRAPAKTAAASDAGPSPGRRPGGNRAPPGELRGAMAGGAP